MSYGRRSTQVRLSDLTDLGVPVAWHEAVAVVRVVAQLVLMDPHAEPDATRVWLCDDGTVRVEPPPRRATLHQDTGSAGLVWPPVDDEMNEVVAITVAGDGALTPVRDTPGQLVAALASLLATLLQPSAPERLRALAESDGSDAMAADVDQFLDAISFFARPDDDGELRGLATRAIAAHEAAERSAALRALTERARMAPPPPAPAPAAAPRRRLAIAGATTAVALLLAVTVAAGWWLARPPAPPATAAPSHTGPAPPQAAARSSAKAHTVTRRPRPARPVTVNRPSVASPAVEAVGERRGPERFTPTVPAGSTADTADAALGQATDREAAPEPDTTGVVRPEAQASETVERERIYDARDAEVTPPTPVRAQMPVHPLAGIPLGHAGTLELIVDEHGDVLRARLVPASARLQDRVMVSAAKAWRFTPARRGGQPVRFRLHMPITW